MDGNEMKMEWMRFCCRQFSLFVWFILVRKIQILLLLLTEIIASNNIKFVLERLQHIRYLRGILTYNLIYIRTGVDK